MRKEREATARFASSDQEPASSRSESMQDSDPNIQLDTSTSNNVQPKPDIEYLQRNDSPNETSMSRDRKLEPIMESDAEQVRESASFSRKQDKSPNRQD